MRFGARLVITCLITGLAGLASDSALAQDRGAIEQFYKGRTITVVIGTSPGGGYDTYGRLLGRHLGRHLPGAPTLVASNMAGAGSNVAAAHIYNVAAQDGTAIGAVFAGVIVEPLLGDASRLKHDPAKFNYLGSANKEVFVCAARLGAKAQIFDDAMNNEVVLGASAEGGPTSDFPSLLAGVLGAKLRIVRGYPGTREITLAIEKGEVDGACGMAWSTLSVQYPKLFAEGPFRVLLQEDLTGHPKLNEAGVPTAAKYVSNSADRAALDLLYAQNLFGRPYVLGPGVPAERVAALRAAFDAAMKDPELLAEARKLNIDIIPSSGAEVQGDVVRLFATPKEVVARVRAALGR